MEYPKDKLQIFNHKTTGNKNVGIVELLINTNEYLECLYIEGNGFEGMKSLKYYLDGCPYKCFLADKDSNLIANIHIAQKEIFIQQYKNKINAKFSFLFYDKIKAYSCGHYVYAERLMTVLKKFYFREYRLHLVRESTAIELNEMLNNDVPIERQYTIIKKDVPLRDIQRGINH